MMPIVMKLALFHADPEGIVSEVERKNSRRILLFLMEALSYADSVYLGQHPTTPSVYVRQPDGSFLLRYVPEEFTEEWLRIPEIFAAGGGDCEDLACARVAELRRAGVTAHPWISWRKSPGGEWIYHARAWRESVTSNLPPISKAKGFPIIVPAPADVGGWIEDPARALGM